MITITDTRLLAIINEIKHCNVLVDIGSDHGYVPVYACQNNLCKRAIATDISYDSLQKANELAKRENINNIAMRLGNGTEVLEDNDYDTVVIAGMGGMEIIKILTNTFKPFKKYILSPQRHQYELRKFLSQNNLCPIKDYKVVSKNRYYDIIVAEQGNYTPSEAELHFGKMANECFESYKDNEIAKLIKYYHKAKNNAKANLEYKLKLLGVDIDENN